MPSHQHPRQLSMPMVSMTLDIPPTSVCMDKNAQSLHQKPACAHLKMNIREYKKIIPTHTNTLHKKITLLQVSCIASSPAFRDRELFPRYFQLLPTDASLAIAYLGVIQFYEWKRVAIIVQNENLFTVVRMYACMYVNWSHSKGLSQIYACMLKLMRFRHLPLTMYCDV